MMTGEFDYVNPPAVSKATAAKINGAVFKSLPNFGHFPLAEHPSEMIPHLLEAITFIQNTGSSEYLHKL